TAGTILRKGAAMIVRSNRRRFLQASAAGGALLGLGDLGFLSQLRPVSADEASLDPKVVRLQPEIEPLVRLLEDTPRDRLVDEAAVPPSQKARAAFTAAMDDWDESAADAAVTGLARTAGAHEIFDLFARYGCRDFRSIGHKAIYVANSWRTLNCIGWQHAEP